MATGDLRGLKENSEGSLDEITLQASAAEIAAGTEISKVATPKNMKDAKIIPIHVGTSAPADTTILWLDTN